MFMTSFPGCYYNIMPVDHMLYFRQCLCTFKRGLYNPLSDQMVCESADERRVHTGEKLESSKVSWFNISVTVFGL